MAPDDQDVRPQGWYRDGGGERWWDGAAWTGRRRRWTAAGWVEHHEALPSEPRPPSPGRNRPRWQWLLLGFVGLMVLVGLLSGEGEDEQTAVETKTVTVIQPAPATETTSAASEPVETLSDARAAVNADDYAGAVAIAAALGASEEDAIRRRIANRLARRALFAGAQWEPQPGWFVASPKRRLSPVHSN